MPVSYFLKKPFFCAIYKDRMDPQAEWEAKHGKPKKKKQNATKTGVEKTTDVSRFDSETELVTTPASFPEPDEVSANEPTEDQNVYGSTPFINADRLSPLSEQCKPSPTTGKRLMRCSRASQLPENANKADIHLCKNNSGHFSSIAQTDEYKKLFEGNNNNQYGYDLQKPERGLDTFLPNPKNNKYSPNLPLHESDSDIRMIINSYARPPIVSDSSEADMSKTECFSCFSKKFRSKHRQDKPRPRDVDADVEDSVYRATRDCEYEASEMETKQANNCSRNMMAAQSPSDHDLSSSSSFVTESSSCDIVSVHTASLAFNENASSLDLVNDHSDVSDRMPPSWHESIQVPSHLSRNNCGTFPPMTECIVQSVETRHQLPNLSNGVKADTDVPAKGYDGDVSGGFVSGQTIGADGSRLPNLFRDARGNVARILVVYDNNKMELVDVDRDLDRLVSATKDQPFQSESLDQVLEHFSSLPIDKIDHYSKLGEYIRMLKREDRMIDVIVHIGKQLFSAHRHVLACFSRFFADILGNIPNKQKLPIELKLENVTVDAFQSFLQYVYTGDVDLNCDNVGELLLAAEQLKVPNLLKRCQRYMENVDPYQALHILGHGAEKDTSVFNLAFSTVLAHYVSLFDADDFVDLDVDTLCKILSHDDLVLIAELDVFWTGLKWVVYDVNRRLTHLTRVMKCVRFPFMSQAELIYCVTVTDLLRADPACRSMILTSNWLLMCHSFGKNDPLRLPRPNQRNCMINNKRDMEAAFKLRDKRWSNMSIQISRMMSDPAFQESIRVQSQAELAARANGSKPGSNSGPEFEQNSNMPVTDDFLPSVHEQKLQVMRAEIPDSTFTYGYHKNVMKSDSAIGYGYHKNEDIMAAASRITSSIKYCSKPALEDILVVGGFKNVDKKKEVIQVERYNSTTDQWNHYAGLPEPRHHHAVAVLQQKLFLVGGCDPRKSRKNPVATNTMFMYNLEEREWYKMANMNECRMHHSVCIAFGMLYTIGGQDERNRVLCSVECFDLRTNSWSYVAPMRTARCGMGATVHDGYIYVAGGFGEPHDKKSRMPVLNQMEIYSPRTNRWTDACRLAMPRCYANLVSVENHLYLCGGATRNGGPADNLPLVSVTQVDVYDPFEDRWDACTDLFQARHNAGAIVMGNKIYIMGGVSSEQNDTLQTIECFDTTTRTWDRSITKLPHPATGIGCVSVPIRSF
ncbi:uncharacterized protein LOC121369209 isoform X2 [Gigantopelta aegis]|uniref:uncharacterized protein LOC121369209 isoform X2 n=1 Tax=Gigantopelta aegis TaxID=1735272 RepID=UPI001B88A225|nr:uncharacterized protein LOC121369209 isoform X2 [Gigantopelta aegis]